ncbi:MULTISPECIES: tol-pal system protein YbgF [unclassified Pseudodesulfovibrio]|uniref:tol-pal system protein YbgF n=1 Tax=unclassified Pseudodesulfovibrio TaxID=2661612 RepID=UPI000FEBCE47|nr:MULTISPECIES: tol-pal system protein YbgF [unclassified Pseudodesulfovibrio]MCJ2163292.1 tol-pal system protein YbgF [Pseudodesulfovibrio sp. S3-i]RWU07271.1 tol-pal system protein YbgF [Pseudodesulfovibrio sp. S3]
MKCLKLVLLTLFCLSFVGCATTKKNADTTSASTEWRIKSLEESFLNFREKQRQAADENTQNMEKLDRRLADIETELAALRTGGVTDAPDEAPPMDQGWVTDLKPEDDGWVEGQKTAENPMIESDEEKPWATVPKPPAVIPAPKVIKRPEAKKPIKVKPLQETSSSKGLYDKAYAQYNAGSFDASRATFDTFLAKYPNDPLAPNSLYWKGETYYSQKDYAQAILTFKEVTGRFPKHDKSASAMLKIGMSYDRVGDRDNAVFYMRALLEDFPDSDAAGLARKELKRLGG